MRDSSLSKVSSSGSFGPKGSAFQNLCTKYITDNLPTKIDVNRNFPVSAFAANTTILFKISNSTTIKDIVKEIQSDSKLLKSFKAYNEVFYFLPHDFFYSPLVKRNIKGSIKTTNIKPEIISYTEVVYHLKKSDNLNDYHLLAQADLEQLYSKTFQSPNTFINIIDEIVAHVFNTVHEVAAPEIKQKSFNRLKLKISVNFGFPEREKIRIFYMGVWDKKNIFERYVFQNFDLKREHFFSLRSKIQNAFKKNTFYKEVYTPVNYEAIFSAIAEELIPPGKHHYHNYLTVSEAIVLYFFEYCDFGIRYENEEQSLFQKHLGEFNDPPE